MSKLKSYHFDLGNSTVGPIGMCARIIATSKKRALELLKQALPECEVVEPYGNEGIEYIHVYFNDGAISVKDIDEWEYLASLHCDCGWTGGEGDLFDDGGCPTCGRLSKDSDGPRPHGT